MRWLAVLGDPPNIRVPVTRIGESYWSWVSYGGGSPAGRLLTALALVPHISGAYELVPLFLIPREMGILVLLS